MKHTVCMIVYGEDETVQPFRKDWEMPNISAEDFDARVHTGKIFMFPDADMPKLNSMYMWQYCSPENDEEKEKLIAMGKWGTLSSQYNNNKPSNDN